MENREQEILSEIKSMMASIRSQLEMLDAKMAELQQVVDPEGFEANSINIEIDDAEMQSQAFAVEVQEIPLIVDEPSTADPEPVIEAETVAEPEAVAEAETVAEPETEPLPEPELEIPAEEEPSLIEEDDDDLPFAEVPDLPEAPAVSEIPVAAEEDDDDLPGIFDEPEVVTIAAKTAAAAKPTINDAHSADQAWRKDMPGTPVRDIRSAISLNDRVFFINTLFDENAQAFVDTLTKINAMETLDQVVEFITGQYPHWNLNSDTVYRFMMAVRRKVK